MAGVYGSWMMCSHSETVDMIHSWTCLNKRPIITDLYLYLFSIITFAGLSSIDASAQRSIVDNERPNVLFIMVDDLRPELGCYGQAYAKTPNIDRLAARSAVFMKHYVAVPTCGASRAALLTGKLPRIPADITNEVFEHRIASGIGDRSDGPESFVEQFRRNGYHTVGMKSVDAPDIVLGKD